MKQILVTYATRAGSTEEVAACVADELSAAGATVETLPIKAVQDVNPYDAVVIGSAIRMGRWLPGAVEFIETHRERLSQIPTAYFLVSGFLSEDTPQMRQTVLAYLDPVRALLEPTSIGLFWQDGGRSFAFTTLHGQRVQIAGQGLYHYDSIAIAAQERGQDVVTLFLGIPLLMFALWLARRGSLRGQLLLTGTLGYFLYTYMSMAFLTAYNPLFLVYVALFSSSLFAFVLAFTSLDMQELPAHFSSHLPRRSIAGFFFTVGGFLLLMWLGLIVPPLVQGQATQALENMTTLVIQAMDMGIIVPVSMLSGTLLLRRAPLGYLLASVVLIKFFTYGTAVTAMVIGELLAGVRLGVVVVVGFPLLTVIGIGLTVVLLRNLSNVQLVQSAHA